MNHKKSYKRNRRTLMRQDLPHTPKDEPRGQLSFDQLNRSRILEKETFKNLQDACQELDDYNDDL